MDSLRFAQVNTPEKLAEWKEFADSFDHGTDTPMTPIVTVSRGDKMFGYYTLLNHPIVFPSFHPKHTSPRDFKDMIEAFSNAQCIASMSTQYPNGCCFVGLVANGLPIGRHYVTKMGYENLGIELHRRVP